MSVRNGVSEICPDSYYVAQHLGVEPCFDTGKLYMSSVACGTVGKSRVTDSCETWLRDQENQHIGSNPYISTVHKKKENTVCSDYGHRMSSHLLQLFTKFQSDIILGYAKAHLTVHKATTFFAWQLSLFILISICLVKSVFGMEVVVSALCLNKNECSAVWILLETIYFSAFCPQLFKM